MEVDGKYVVEGQLREVGGWVKEMRGKEKRRKEQRKWTGVESCLDRKSVV